MDAETKQVGFVDPGYPRCPSCKMPFGGQVTQHLPGCIIRAEQERELLRARLDETQRWVHYFGNWGAQFIGDGFHRLMQTFNTRIADLQRQMEEAK